MGLPVIEQETRAAYMVMWISRKRKHGAYSIQMLRGVLQYFFDEVVADLLGKGHIKSEGDGYSLTDEGVRVWSLLATESSTVNSFDPELKVWANWIMKPRALLECLQPNQWLHPDRHVDNAAHKEASKKGWVIFKGDSQKTRLYQITEAGLEHLASLREQEGAVCPLSSAS